MKKRHLQAASVIQSVVGMLLLTERPKPELGLLTVTNVEVAADLSQATIYVSSSQKDISSQLKNHLDSVKSKIQLELGHHMRSRCTPRIHFKVDERFEHYEHIEKILDEIKTAKQKNNQ